jgi:FKBP-type peptidyl-prolyl cis-trans isomerase
MIARFLLLVLGFLIGCAGCSRPEPTPAPVVDAALERRERHFGPEVAKDPAIKWRTSGLGIKVVVPGEGPAPQAMDRVRVHYTGRLKDGKVIDDSRARGQPADFVVNRLITGWAAAMPELKPGGKALFYIPPHLGYGGLRAGDIPPNSGLIFEVELIAVNPALPAKTPAEK